MKKKKEGMMRARLEPKTRLVLEMEEMEARELWKLINVSLKDSHEFQNMSLKEFQDELWGTICQIWGVNA